MLKHCDACGAGFSVYPSQSSRRYCSKECYGSTLRRIERASCAECGKTFAAMPSTVKRQQRMYCSSECSAARAVNTRIVDKNGYVRVGLPLGDPLRVGVSPYILEHRFVMSKYLGRRLAKGETVHHINGDRADNRLENLQLRIGHHGPGQTYCCSDCGSRRLAPAAIAAA